MAQTPSWLVKLPLHTKKEVDQMCRRLGGYINESEYVREAVRWKLALDQAALEKRVEVFRLRYRNPHPPKDEESPP